MGRRIPSDESVTSGAEDIELYGSVLSEEEEKLRSESPEYFEAYATGKKGIADAAALRRQASDIKYEDEVTKDTEYKDKRTALEAISGKVESSTDAVVQAKALSSLMANLVKAMAAFQGSKKGIDLSGVDVKSGVDWDMVLKGKMGAIDEERRRLEGGLEERRMTLSERVRQRREAKELEAKSLEASSELTMTTLWKRLADKKAKASEDRLTGKDDRKMVMEEYRIAKDLENQADKDIKAAQYQQRLVSDLVKRKNNKPGRVTEDDLKSVGFTDMIAAEAGVDQSFFDRIFSDKKPPAIEGVTTTITAARNKAMQDKASAKLLKNTAMKKLGVKVLEDGQAGSEEVAKKPAAPAPGATQSTAAPAADVLSAADEALITEYGKRNLELSRAQVIKVLRSRGQISK